MPDVDVLIVGAGAAGCAAALAARQAGAKRVVLVDLANGPGGALAAMGLPFEGPSAKELRQLGVDLRLRTTLLSLDAHRRARLLGPTGPEYIVAGAVVVATGGRETTRGNLRIPGTRPIGVMTGGGALRVLATLGHSPGKRAVLAGEGRWTQVVADALERAATKIVGAVPEVAEIGGWPRVDRVVLPNGAVLDCDLLVLAAHVQAWHPKWLPLDGLAGVFVVGCAAMGDLDAAEARREGEQAGVAAAAYAARVLDF